MKKSPVVHRSSYFSFVPSYVGSNFCMLVRIECSDPDLMMKSWKKIELDLKYVIMLDVLHLLDRVYG